MAIYETIPTINLAEQNELVTPMKQLPELVHANDAAKTVFVDFSKNVPATTMSQTLIDDAIHEMKIRHQNMLLVEKKGGIVGLISFEDILSEKPLRLMHEKGISRTELTVDMLMHTRDQILVIDAMHLKNAKVGHIINTIKAHSAYYILVVKKTKKNKHLIKGFFSASQIGRQLHADLSAILRKEPETIVELAHERKI